MRAQIDSWKRRRGFTDPRDEDEAPASEPQLMPAGGETPNPTYQEVCSGMTGHAEVVQVRYDPQQVSYAQLVEYFWRHIDPTVKDRQFCDIGSPYRTAIFTHSPKQRAIAEASRKALDDSGVLPAPVVTEITDAGPFYAAEDYHQDYYKKNPVRYKLYRTGCGRDARLNKLWGKKKK